MKTDLKNLKISFDHIKNYKKGQMILILFRSYILKCILYKAYKLITLIYSISTLLEIVSGIKKVTIPSEIKHV